MNKLKNIMEKYIWCILLVVILIPFLNKNGILLLKIISSYVKGDIFITYEDFPNISEWLQITTSIAFSYLLWRTSVASNRLNKNNFMWQKLNKANDELKSLLHVISELEYLNRNISSKLSILNIYDNVFKQSELKFSIFKSDILMLNEYSMHYIYANYSIEYSDVQNKMNDINNLRRALIIEEMINKQIGNNGVDSSRIDRLVQLYRELYKQLDNLIKVLKKEKLNIRRKIKEIAS